MSIDRQSIFKTFYLFDKHKLPTPLWWARSGKTAPEMRKETAETWLREFAETDKDDWEAATELALQECRHWPDKELMRTLLSRAAAARYWKSEQERTYKPAAPACRTVYNERCRAMLQLAAQGRYSEARQLTRQLSYEGGQA